MTHLPVDASGPTLQKIVEYLMHHQGVDPGIPEKPLMKAVIAPWDADFIDALATPRQRLYDVILVRQTTDSFQKLTSFLFFARLQSILILALFGILVARRSLR